MGYHVIILNQAGIELEHRYVDAYSDLAYISELNECSIIYEGEPHWTPVLAGHDKRYQCFTKDWFRAGVKAQEVFKEQAFNHELMLEEISQDQASFKHYIKSGCSRPIKRGDFLIRNAGNIEVDVKCRTFRREDGDRYFYFLKEDFEKHCNMISYTHTPVIIAVYERLGDGVKQGEPFMFDIGELNKQRHLLREANAYEDLGVCFKIPLAKTKKGFRLIENYKKGKL